MYCGCGTSWSHILRSSLLYRKDWQLRPSHLLPRSVDVPLILDPLQVLLRHIRPRSVAQLMHMDSLQMMQLLYDHSKSLISDCSCKNRYEQNKITKLIETQHKLTAIRANPSPYVFVVHSMLESASFVYRWWPSVQRSIHQWQPAVFHQPHLTTTSSISLGQLNLHIFFQIPVDCSFFENEFRLMSSLDYFSPPELHDRINSSQLCIYLLHFSYFNTRNNHLPARRHFQISDQVKDSP